MAPTRASEAMTTDQNVPTILVFSADLMDQSRLGRLGNTVAVRRVDDVGALDVNIDPDTAVIDVSRPDYGPVAAAIRDRWPDLSIIGYGPHGDAEALTAASAWCTEVVARSVFFSRVQRGTLTGET